MWEWLTLSGGLSGIHARTSYGEEQEYDRGG